MSNTTTHQPPVTSTQTEARVNCIAALHLNRRKSALIFLCLSSFTAASDELECNQGAENQALFTIESMQLISHPVFEENKANSLYLHSVANWLHINTQEQVIKDLLPFTEHDEISTMELTQAERLLNDHSFLRKSQISLIDACNDSDKKQLKVETWDTWSLLPSISFGRRAGNNKFGFGFKEDNFLGLGIHAGIQYKKDHLRSGYQLDFRIPLNIAKLSTLALEFTDNDDGRKTYLSYSKPFYQQSSKQQYLISTLTDKRLDSIHQNGELAWQFSHKTEQTEFAYGHLMAYTSAGVIRAHFGITKEQHLFTHLTSDVLSTLPTDRSFTFPWFGLEFNQADYKTFSNIRFINHREDINLGWQFISKIGKDLNTAGDNNNAGYHFENNLTKGVQWHDTLMIFSASNTIHWQKQQPNHHKYAAEFELHQYLTPQWAGYLKTNWISEKNQYLDNPLTLGGDTGVRGYSNQFQHGEHRWSASAELRYNPHWELYQLVNVAWAGFVDHGKAWGQTNTENLTDSSLKSIGLGLRLFSSHSSEGNVVHMDLIKPLTTGVNVDSWQWAVQVKHSL
ncbi:ShlB/FhaC/HecB family hemolysin secretion/activation protein [Pseudoalteromonas tunicata]|jgi:outer membrane protein assembly factor BamA|uniref:Haemolysin activator HlyB C-terminal domain-containing protein n=1 Tax=Pseudoalteromonas tunicata D2 TaxID=87626 RepID=A4C520_9GAMM|nr:ShlB/FhaC/HecB family hemolysin secretion/activation protein [Pseudoalteromonas tunicata]ATC96874.1 hypothetical protein PTUN_b0496 [Pseudoalteromonas tunicata]AXT33011.1 hypothetical protein D1819_19460 [Pseudoalteromonas tunicata]EAR30652.1 hypothetical protein PTD2_03746 [Pseudoalteromonas tunicata D2]